jgi:predicted transcriptional regulator
MRLTVHISDEMGKEVQRLVEIEDRYWGKKARKAVEEGFVTEENTRAWLKRKLDAKTSR